MSFLSVVGLKIGGRRVFLVRRAGAMGCLGARRLAAHEAGNGGGRLFDLGFCDARVAGAFGFDGGAGHAVADVLFEQVQGDGVERLGDRGNLGQDVDAVLVFVDHAGDTADLPFDAAQALEVRLFVGGVTVLGFGCLAAAACAGVRLGGFLGGRAGCGADLGGCAVAALVVGGFHGSSIYPRGVSRKGGVTGRYAVRVRAGRGGARR